MFQLGLAEIIQADREREIAELVRQRQLLGKDADGQHPDDAPERSTEARAIRPGRAGTERVNA